MGSCEQVVEAGSSVMSRTFFRNRLKCIKDGASERTIMNRWHRCMHTFLSMSILYNTVHTRAQLLPQSQLTSFFPLTPPPLRLPASLLALRLPSGTVSSYNYWFMISILSPRLAWREKLGKLRSIHKRVFIDRLPRNFAVGAVSFVWSCQPMASWGGGRERERE